MTEPQYDYESIDEAIEAIPDDAAPGFVCYLEPDDWAGLGFDHLLVAWEDAEGFPRSYTVKP